MSDESHAELDRLVRLSVTQIHEKVRELEAKGNLISYHYEYPKLDQFDSGQPRVSFGKGPLDYHHLFKMGESDRWSVSFDDVPAFVELAKLAIADDALRSRLLVPGITEMDEWRERFVTVGVSSIPLEIFDRLMNTIGSDYSEEDFEEAWVPMRNGLLWKGLPIDIVVPVCLTTFSTDHAVDLHDRFRLEPLPGDEQVARMPKSIWGGTANECVVAAATHAVTFSGCTFDGESRMLADYGRPGFYPLDEIELAFEALRIAAAAPIGYAQIFMRPIGWAWHYKADLTPVIQGSIARRYPPSFDECGWLEEASTVSTEEVDLAATILQQLDGTSTRQRLASRRLSSAALRSEEDDAVLDLCIALESALGDEDRNEMTYKLSLRAAAMLSFEEPKAEDLGDMVRRIKNLYNWRSAIVHAGDVDKARNKFAGSAGGAKALELAFSLLRRILVQLALHPDLHEAAKIDGAVLVGGLGNRSDAAGSDPESS